MTSHKCVKLIDRAVLCMIIQVQLSSVGFTGLLFILLILNNVYTCEFYNILKICSRILSLWLRYHMILYIKNQNLNKPPAALTCNKTWFYILILINQYNWTGLSCHVSLKVADRPVDAAKIMPP